MMDPTDTMKFRFNLVSGLAALRNVTSIFIFATVPVSVTLIDWHKIDLLFITNDPLEDMKSLPSNTNTTT